VPSSDRVCYSVANSLNVLGNKRGNAAFEELHPIPSASGQCTVSTFMLIMYIQLENASSNVSSDRDALSMRSLSMFGRSASASSASASSRNPRPCGASGTRCVRLSRTVRKVSPTRRAGVVFGVVMSAVWPELVYK